MIGSQMFSDVPMISCGSSGSGGSGGAGGPDEFAWLGGSGWFGVPTLVIFGHFLAIILNPKVFTNGSISV